VTKETPEKTIYFFLGRGYFFPGIFFQERVFLLLNLSSN
jgi:hypothetical protein